MFNFSAQAQTVSFEHAPFEGRYRDCFSGEAVDIKTSTELTLPPRGYRVYAR